MKSFTNGKRYYTVNQYYRERFQSKVYKIPLNGDFSCPNRDGLISHQGCIFCSEMGAGDFAGNKTDSLSTQFQLIKKMMQNKWAEGKLIAYFQANTNTYGSLTKIKALFEEALTLDKDIIGLSLATRPDCLSEAVLDYLEALNKRTYLTVELGLQSMHEASLRWMHRGHDLACFIEGVKALRQRGIAVVVHIINGLPNEGKEEMLETIRFLNSQDIQGIKIHMLYIQKKTALAALYEKHPFPLLSKDDYVDIVTEQIEWLDPGIVIHRLTGDAPRDELIAPRWTLKKFVVTNDIDKRLRQRDSYQGIRWVKP